MRTTSARHGLRFALASALTVLALVAAACGGSNDQASAGAQGAGNNAEQKKSIRVGLVLNGPRNDKSFAQSHYEGVLQAEKEIPGLKLTSTVENADTPQKRLDAFKNLAPNNDVVLGAGAYFTETSPAVAPLFPHTQFLITTGATRGKLNNVTSLVPDEGLTAVVAGAVMAKLTKSKKVGIIGGAEIPPTVQSIAGVKAGVHDADPSIKVASAIVGDFNDVAKAKAAAEAMIADGADQIFAFLDAGVQGVYQAAQSKDIGVYQIITLKCGDYPNVVGSAMQDNVRLVVDGLKQAAEGTLKAGATFYTLKTPEILKFQLCPKYEKDPKIAQIVKQTTERVNKGELTFPKETINARPDYEVVER